MNCTRLREMPYAISYIFHYKVLRLACLNPFPMNDDWYLNKHMSFSKAFYPL